MGRGVCGIRDGGVVGFAGRTQGVLVLLCRSGARSWRTMFCLGCVVLDSPSYSALQCFDVWIIT